VYNFHCIGACRFVIALIKKKYIKKKRKAAKNGLPALGRSPRKKKKNKKPGGGEKKKQG